MTDYAVHRSEVSDEAWRTLWCLMEPHRRLHTDDGTAYLSMVGHVHLFQEGTLIFKHGDGWDELKRGSISF